MVGHYTAVFIEQLRRYLWTTLIGGRWIISVLEVDLVFGEFYRLEVADTWRYHACGSIRGGSKLIIGIRERIPSCAGRDEGRFIIGSVWIVVEVLLIFTVVQVILKIISLVRGEEPRILLKDLFILKVLCTWVVEDFACLGEIFINCKLGGHLFGLLPMTDCASACNANLWWVAIFWDSLPWFSLIILRLCAKFIIYDRGIVFRLALHQAKLWTFWTLRVMMWELSR